MIKQCKFFPMNDKDHADFLLECHWDEIQKSGLVINKEQALCIELVYSQTSCIHLLSQTVRVEFRSS